MLVQLIFPGIRIGCVSNRTREDHAHIQDCVQQGRSRIVLAFFSVDACYLPHGLRKGIQLHPSGCSTSTEGLNPGLKSRVLMRRAGVLASVAFWQSRRGLNPQLAAERSIEDLAGVDKSVLDDEGLVEYANAAVRVGASRLAAQSSPARSGKLIVRTAPGAPGETCLSLFDAKKQDAEPLIRRCTYGTVWIGSASSNADGTALTLAVQPLATWRELWVFRQTANGWTASVLPPNLDGPGLGYIE